MMRKIGLILLYAASIFTLIGGLGDQFINNYLDVHLNFLGNPVQSDLLRRSEKLSMLILHATGGGFMSTGLAMLALTHYGIRKGLQWANLTFIFIAIISQGINAYVMYMAGSYFWYPVAVLAIALSGILIYRAGATMGID